MTSAKGGLSHACKSKTSRPFPNCLKPLCQRESRRNIKSLRRGLTRRPYFCRVLWFERKYFGHVSSNRKSLSTRYTYRCFGLFCNFLDDVWVYVGINSFPQGLVKFMAIGS